ncbi:hypothetical protein NPIL_693691, partial [Nephila pilipes]
CDKFCSGTPGTLTIESTSKDFEGKKITSEHHAVDTHCSLFAAAASYSLHFTSDLDEHWGHFKVRLKTQHINYPHA